MGISFVTVFFPLWDSFNLNALPFAAGTLGYPGEAEEHND